MQSITAQEEIRFIDGSLAAIMSIAKERNKNVFIDTYADWCIPCKRMKKKFKDRDVALFFNEHFINYRVNMQNPTRASELRRKYDVVFLPTMFILDPDGVIKYQVDKELTVSELLNAGQRALDPSSYHVSESTTVRRNDGSISGGSNVTVIKNEPPKLEELPKSAEPEEIVVKAEPKVEPQDEVPVSETSEATQRSKMLDGYETVEESSDKVLHVLGAGEMPPEILRHEAYLRLEFMDGSHTGVANEYLNSQSNWDTDENRKFILDFIGSTYSKEYQYLIDHKNDFVTQFGNEKVKRTLEVLTYRTLHNAVPRPTLSEAIELYQSVDKEEASRKAYYYYINRLIADDDIEQIKAVSTEYLESNDSDDEMMYLVSRYICNSSDPNKKDQEMAIDLIKQAIDIQPDNLNYLDLLGNQYSKMGKTKKAKKAFDRATKEAKKQGKDYKDYQSKSQAFNG